MSYNKGLVNLDASHYAGSAFTSTVNPSTVNPTFCLPSVLTCKPLLRLK